MNTKTFLAAFALVLTTCLAAVNAQCGDPGCTSCGQVAFSPAPVAAQCGCGQSSCDACQPVQQVSCGCRKASCLKCRTRASRAPRTSIFGGSCNTCQTAGGGCTECPKCEGDMCKLELDKGTVKKTCFKTEQKSVCIPKVRFPWQKCCPPGTSKTRLVTKLSKHTYECPNCSYKWSVQKPTAPVQPQSAPTALESSPVYDSYIPQAQQQVPPPQMVPTTVVGDQWKVSQPVVDGQLVQPVIQNN